MNYDLEEIEKIDIDKMFEGSDMICTILNLIEDWKEMNEEINELYKEILEYGLR